LAKIIPLKIFGGGHFAIFVSLFAVDDSAVNNKRTLTIYVSYCSETFAAHAGVVNGSIG